MADKPETNPPPPPATEEETAFWEKFTGTLDSWWDGKMKQYQEQQQPKGGGKTDPASTPAPGTSRTGGKRMTLPDLIADMVFGPPKE